MGRPEPDSVASQGVRWATRVTSVGLEFALPGLLGGYLDRRWGTGPALTVVGALLGFLAGMAHILAIAREDTGTRPGGRGPNASQSGSSDHG